MENSFVATGFVTHSSCFPFDVKIKSAVKCITSEFETFEKPYTAFSGYVNNFS